VGLIGLSAWLVACSAGPPSTPAPPDFPSTASGGLTLTYPLDEWGVWYGPIGPNPAATLAMGLRHVARGPRTWDVLALRWVDHDGSDGGRTATAMRLAGLDTEVATHATTSVLELARFADWEDYLASRTAKTRHEIRRQRRRLDRDRRVEHVRVRPRSAADGDGDPRWDLYEECVRIARRSWQANSPNGNTLCHERVATLLRAAHARAALSLTGAYAAVPDRVLLIDDVMTTGATVSHAASLLKEAGASRVDVLVFAMEH